MNLKCRVPGDGLILFVLLFCYYLVHFILDGNLQDENFKYLRLHIGHVVFRGGAITAITTLPSINEN
jgi:hypothetical protein